MLSGIRWRSLRNKIIAWSFVPTAIILVAVALVSLLAAELTTYTDPLSDQFLSVR